MNKIILLSSLLFCLACSTDPSKSADEQERPADWVSDVRLVVALDSINDDFADLHVVSSNSSAPLSGLIDQVYDLAFSGDADVFASTLFGEVDLEHQLDPKSLLESLEFFDTVTVENLMTGEIKDTVVDLSFNKSAVTSFTILFSIDDEQSIAFNPTLLSMGKQVFSTQTGEFRGYSDKFFMAVNDGPQPSHENLDKLLIFSDSLGQFQVNCFQLYREYTKRGLSETIREKHGVHDFYEIQFKLSFDYSQSKLLMEEVRINPLENPAVL